MALAGSGPLSTADWVAEFSSPTPGNTSQLYRGGAYVPSTEVQLQLSGCVSQYSRFFPQYLCSYFTGFGPATEGQWAAVTKTLGVNEDGFFYAQGSFVETDGAFTYHQITRCNYTYGPVAINTSVPTSGAVNTANYYGAKA